MIFVSNLIFSTQGVVPIPLEIMILHLLVEKTQYNCNPWGYSPLGYE